MRALTLTLAAIALLPRLAAAADAQPSTPPKQEPAISIEITGDKEVPLVLYILPWQAPEAALPNPPKLDDPSLRPLTPCELDDSLAAEEVAAWQCDEQQPR